MKIIKQVSVTFFMLIALSVSAQQGINYKAIVKNGSGNVVASQNITVQFQILQGAGMTNVYQETHSPTTDANGIVIVNIGEGSVDSGIYATIDWGVDDHFLNVQINTGSGLTDMGTTQFMAVPYALNAQTAENAATSIDDLSDGKSKDTSLFLGHKAGLSDDNRGNDNVGIGYEALFTNFSGRNNVANGFLALYSNRGNENVAIGSQALIANSTGYENTANGSQALAANTSGYENTANGYRALYNNTGIRNSANGHSALKANTTGNLNTASGWRALYLNTTGSNNTAIGNDALINNTTGSNNTAIGFNAQVPNGAANGQVRIGSTIVNYAGVQVPWTVTSDKRWKENIRELPYGLDLVKQLKPVDYIRKNNEHKTREMGFIAQDVEALLTKIGYTDQGFLHKDDKGFMSLRYNDFIALLTKAIQEQQEIIESLQSTVTGQQSEIKTLTSELVKHKDEQNKNIKHLLKRMQQLEAINNQ